MVEIAWLCIRKSDGSQWWKFGNKTSATILSALIELGGLGLAAVPSKGKQSLFKVIFLSLIGIYSVSLLCSALINQYNYQIKMIEKEKELHDLERKIAMQNIQSIRANEKFIRESIQNKREELTILIQKGYIGASRKLSAEISEMEKKLLNVARLEVKNINYQEREEKPKTGVFWLCAGRVLLVVLNFLAASKLHNYFHSFSNRQDSFDHSSHEIVDGKVT